jgi:hypothetical protein
VNAEQASKRLTQEPARRVIGMAAVRSGQLDAGGSIRSTLTVGETILLTLWGAK